MLSVPGGVGSDGIELDPLELDGAARSGSSGPTGTVAPDRHPTELDAVARRKVVTFLVVGALCVLGVVALYLLAVHTHRGRELDQVAYEGRSVARPVATRASEHLLRTISDSSLAFLGAALVLTALVRRRPRLALAVGWPSAAPWSRPRC